VLRWRAWQSCDLDVFKRLIRVKDQAHRVAGLPAVSLLYLLQDARGRVFENAWVFIVRAFFGDMPKEVVAVTRNTVVTPTNRVRFWNRFSPTSLVPMPMMSSSVIVVSWFTVHGVPFIFA